MWLKYCRDLLKPINRNFSSQSESIDPGRQPPISLSDDSQFGNQVQVGEGSILE